ncbi:MAG: hypothetical protein UU16_C0015G0010 [Candidatus Woesebacteria bacterium GW2011_GWA2_40_7]|uniref:PPM-type phosphatase domain-containing protein n=3 Tax=Candidatus Woeseibacteriota TaxID=1752722 RepID=A0A0G0P1C0_9BACT|nr:MAG: hypothetical protein UT17_C0004G0262 [Candidatus Woesebacteria bacterium GW2011_GWB1_39_10]KKR73714.1 MAG: hypothetical protein UU16_C0015G0010 [Candidatus Woesebacteria bacterium GW2011_GWA2_40_7]KKS90905.1 MAG: hypothetical protein UV66_C0001G0262 [Candidatus Woesebacteria bacterium GW2011_GWA1_43_12]
MESNIRVRSAQAIGRSHLLGGKNRQDALKTGMVEVDGEKIVYGVICDGCSEGETSEVGANLATSFIGRQIEILVKSHISLDRIPWILHKRTVGFLKDILGKISFDSPNARVLYIKNNLLFTILGFIYTERETLIFAQGDGDTVVNDELTIRDENNIPRYIGYSLVERKFLSSNASPVQTDFDVFYLNGESFNRLAIASDALSEEPSFLVDLWGHINPIGLQRRVNVWSLVNHKFQDDLSIITLEKIPKEE